MRAVGSSQRTIGPLILQRRKVNPSRTGGASASSRSAKSTEVSTYVFLSVNVIVPPRPSIFCTPVLPQRVDVNGGGYMHDGRFGPFGPHKSLLADRFWSLCAGRPVRPVLTPGGRPPSDRATADRPGSRPSARRPHLAARVRRCRRGPRTPTAQSPSRTRETPRKGR